MTKKKIKSQRLISLESRQNNLIHKRKALAWSLLRHQLLSVSFPDKRFFKLSSCLSFSDCSLYCLSHSSSARVWFDACLSIVLGFTFAITTLARVHSFLTLNCLILARYKVEFRVIIRKWTSIRIIRRGRHFFN